MNQKTAHGGNGGSAAPDSLLAALLSTRTSSGPERLALELDSEGKDELEEVLAAARRNLAAIEDAARERMRSAGRDQAPHSVGVVMMQRSRRV